MLMIHGLESNESLLARQGEASSILRTPINTSIEATPLATSRAQIHIITSPKPNGSNDFQCGPS